MDVARWTGLWTGPSLHRSVRVAMAERIVRWVLWPLWVAAVYTAITIYATVGIAQPSRLVPSIVACIAFSVVTWLWRSGRALTSAAVLSASAAAAIISAVLLNGILAPAYWAGLLLVALVVPLFGLRWGMVSAFGLAAAGGSRLLLERFGWTSPTPELPAIASFGQYAGYLVLGLIIVTAPQRLLIRALRDAERKRQEAETAREAEAQAELAFHAVFDQASLALVLLHSDGRIAQFNQRAARWLGAEDAHLVGLPLTAAPRFRDEQREQLIDAVRSAARGSSSQHEIELTSPDGTRGVYQISVSPFHTATGSLGYVIVEAVDVSDLVETRSLLAQARRLEALGKLSGAVAHDFNNMLAAIMGGCELVKIARRSGNLERVDENVALIQTSVLRAADLTKKLLAFGRRDRFNSEPLEVNRLVDDISLLFGRTLRKNVEVMVDTDRDELYIDADAAALEHALLNLALNAQDAMPDGGSLKLSTRLVAAARGMAATHGRRETHSDVRHDGPFVMISVADTGSGMSDDVRERLFEPFFTTKEVGKGTGLGLAAVHGTMRSHRGAIAVHTREGHGTTFELFFPASEQARSTPRLVSLAVPATTRLCARVLLADDEPLVRATLAEVLQQAGCEVTAVANGEELLEGLALGPRPDVIVTDLGMPGLEGIKLVQTLEAQCPGCPLLLITGFSGQDVSSAFSGRSQHRLLRKPFTGDELLSALQALVDTSVSLESVRPERRA